MTPRKPLNAGDKVWVYNLDPANKALGPHKCRVIEVSKGLPCGQWLTVETVLGTQVIVHSKQCRRLKPKRKPREFWIVKHPANDGPYAYDTFESAERGAGYYQPGREIIHVREVLK